MLEVGRGEGSRSSHFFDNGLPHNPKFSSNELLSNVLNCSPCGIGPVSWLLETLKDSRKVSYFSCSDICPESLFCERSSDSNVVRFPNDDGI